MWQPILCLLVLWIYFFSLFCFCFCVFFFTCFISNWKILCCFASCFFSVEKSFRCYYANNCYWLHSIAKRQFGNVKRASEAKEWWKKCNISSWFVFPFLAFNWLFFSHFLFCFCVDASKRVEFGLQFKKFKMFKQKFNSRKKIVVFFKNTCSSKYQVNIFPLSVYFFFAVCSWWWKMSIENGTKSVIKVDSVEKNLPNGMVCLFSQSHLFSESSHHGTLNSMFFLCSVHDFKP